VRRIYMGATITHWRAIRKNHLSYYGTTLGVFRDYEK
jgi:hypothetical protein